MLARKPIAGFVVAAGTLATTATASATAYNDRCGRPHRFRAAGICAGMAATRRLTRSPNRRAPRRAFCCGPGAAASPSSAAA
jgi:hypothetical protein